MAYDCAMQEACFKDVVVVYRAAISDKSQTPGEFDIINDSNSDFLKRNIVLKRFCSIPIADLELIFPEKKVFMPPQVNAEDVDPHLFFGLFT